MAAETVKKYSSAVVAVDNCYGEFVQKYEPVALGADKDVSADDLGRVLSRGGDGAQGEEQHQRKQKREQTFHRGNLLFDELGIEPHKNLSFLEVYIIR